MKHSQLLFAVLLTAFVGSAQAATKTFADWEACRDAAEESVDFNEVGNAGVEAAIKEQCGMPPAKEPSKATGIVGMAPYDIVRSKAFKAKFKQITKGKYTQLVERLVVASETELQGDWVVGEGMMPHAGGSDEAAIAINIKTGKVYAAMLENAKQISAFGFTDPKNPPPFLKKWIGERY
ncbi:MAG TPA: hypothetical protein PL131_11240 [Methylotenera sp.]|nr:hypothetical protein [Methylotenera sp.]HPH06441.1 hypothetical protein [Methylotenera sp.]HPN00412.1 hypothetical protein [Methylotenera sp.]